MIEKFGTPDEKRWAQEQKEILEKERSQLLLT